MFLALALAATLAAATPPSPAPTATPPTPSQIASDALIRLQSHMDLASRAMGADQAESLGERLADDLDAFNDPTIPIPGYTRAAYDERLRAVAVLDASIVDQVVSGTFEPLDGIRGIAERLIKSTADGTWQPVAIYVPPSLAPHPSLVVLLHGNPQTETSMLGAPYFQTLADATNSIIAAPWGRGHYDFYGVAGDDVYQTADEVAKAYGIDRRRIFLAGYSMGGFSVFKIGPTHGQIWRAVLCISGSVLNSEAASVLAAWRFTPIYVVNGKLDVNIPAKYGEMTADWLAGSGIPTSFYQEPTGTHYIPTLMPSLTQAWRDMIAGVIRNTPNVPQQDPLSLPSSLGTQDLDKMPPR